MTRMLSVAPIVALLLVASSSPTLGQTIQITSPDSTLVVTLDGFGPQIVLNSQPTIVSAELLGGKAIVFGTITVALASGEAILQLPLFGYSCTGAACSNRNIRLPDLPASFGFSQYQEIRRVCFNDSYARDFASRFYKLVYCRSAYFWNAEADIEYDQRYQALRGWFIAAYELATVHVEELRNLDFLENSPVYPFQPAVPFVGWDNELDIVLAPGSTERQRYTQVAVVGDAEIDNDMNRARTSSLSLLYYAQELGRQGQCAFQQDIQLWALDRWRDLAPFNPMVADELHELLDTPTSSCG